MYPLNLPGPAFLALYCAVAFCAVVYVAFRVSAIDDRLAPARGGPLRDPYAIAFLRGGRFELVRVAAMALAHRGLLRATGTQLTTVPGQTLETAPPVEQAILQSCATGNSVSGLVADARVAVASDEYQRRLEERNLLAGPVVLAGRRGVVSGPAALLLIFALAKLVYAVSHGHGNVLFLVVLACAATIVLAMIGKRRRTSAGDAELSHLSGLFAALRRRRVAIEGDGLSEAMLLAAVYGVYEFDGSQAGPVHRMFAVARRPSDSSCGGSSCGGGGGCGGCGGCGG